MPYDPEVVATVAVAGEALNNVRGNVAFLLHEEGASADDAVAYAERWGLVNRDRAEKMLEFLTDETWRAYISCYLEGLPLCRARSPPATRSASPACSTSSCSPPISPRRLIRRPGGDSPRYRSAPGYGSASGQSASTRRSRPPCLAWYRARSA